MNSEARNESDAEYDDGVRKIREATALALKELDQLHSVGSGGQEALDVEVARIAHKKVPPQGYDLDVQRRRDVLPRLLIKIRRGEAGYDLVKKFRPENKGRIPETQVRLTPLDNNGKKVVASSRKHFIGRAIAEAVAREGADAVIWLSQWND